MTTKPGEISVVASGESSIAPDLAIVSFSISADGKQLAPTRNDVNRRASAVLTALRGLGIAKRDLSAPDVGIHPQYDYRKGQRLIGYHVQRQLTAKVRDLERLGEVLDGIVAAGANEVHGAEMSAADPSASEHDALASAVAAAKAKALAIASAAGVTLGALTRLEEEADGGFQPMPKLAVMRMEAAGSVPTEVASGDLTVTRRIRAWFVIG